MLVPAEVWTVAKAEQGSAVLIKPIGSEVAVPIFIGPLEAHAILIGLANHKMPRPLTHDLLIATLEQLGTKISRIEITALKEGTFYGRLVLSRAGVAERPVVARRLRRGSRHRPGDDPVGPDEPADHGQVREEAVGPAADGT